MSSVPASDFPAQAGTGTPATTRLAGVGGSSCQAVVAFTALARAEQSAWDFGSPVGDAVGVGTDELGSASGVEESSALHAARATVVTAPRTTARRRGTAATVGAVAVPAGTGHNGLPCRRV